MQNGRAAAVVPPKVALRHYGAPYFEDVHSPECSRDPVAAHARQLKGLGLYSKDLSRLVRRSPEGEGGRDSVKIAQYEVLGNEQNTPVPGWCPRRRVTFSKRYVPDGTIDGRLDS